MGHFLSSHIVDKILFINYVYIHTYAWNTSIQGNKSFVNLSICFSSPVCSSSATTIALVQTDTAYDFRFLTEFALTDGPCDQIGPSPYITNYLLAPKNMINFQFVVGFGCVAMVTKAQLRNTNNARHNNMYRTTKHFVSLVFITLFIFVLILQFLCHIV